MNEFYNLLPFMGGGQPQQPGQAQPGANDNFRQRLIQAYLQNAMAGNGGNVLSGSIGGMTGMQAPQQPQNAPPSAMPMMSQASLPQNALAMNYLRNLFQRQAPYSGMGPYGQMG